VAPFSETGSEVNGKSNTPVVSSSSDKRLSASEEEEEVKEVQSQHTVDEEEEERNSHHVVKDKSIEDGKDKQDTKDSVESQPKNQTRFVIKKK